MTALARVSYRLKVSSVHHSFLVRIVYAAMRGMGPHLYVSMNEEQL